jgi:hypothetical protein
LNKFKVSEKEAAAIRESFKEQLLSDLSVRYVTVMDDKMSTDESKDEMIYDMCGYLLKTRDRAMSRTKLTRGAGNQRHLDVSLCRRRVIRLRD